jgi:hypothetical protein
MESNRISRHAQTMDIQNIAVVVVVLVFGVWCWFDGLVGWLLTTGSSLKN